MVAALAASAALAACEGSNLFERGGAIDIGGSPVVISLTSDGSAAPGELVSVRVQAIGRSGITRINVSFSGAATADRVIEIDPPDADTVSVTASVTVPDPAPLPQLTVTATATDEANRTSAVKTIVVPIIAAGVTKPAESPIR